MHPKTVILQTSGALVHAYNRGVNREKIFWKDSDYRFFLSLIPPALEGRGLTILNYCLMPNHFHFSLRQDEPYAMAGFFQELCGDYAKSVNLARQRVGHLFQGTYESKPVTIVETLPSLTRYIHRNPLEAGLVKDLRQWEFSSFRDYCDGHHTEFIETETVLTMVGGKEAYFNYLVADYVKDDPNLKKCLPRNHQ